MVVRFGMEQGLIGGDTFGSAISILIQRVFMSNKEITQGLAVASHKRCSTNPSHITSWQMSQPAQPAIWVRHYYQLDFVKYNQQAHKNRITFLGPLLIRPDQNLSIMF